ncbi:zinc ribbon domain-containing protein [Kurthia massiliensis]
MDIREWTCPSCDTTLDRDINASQNILAEGLSMLHQQP